MRTLILLPLLALAAMNANAQQPAAEPKTALVIHGGAGYMARESLSAEAEQLARADLQRALDAGNAILQEGGAALDAVQAAIVVLEDSPRFNAGKGAVCNARLGVNLCIVKDRSTRCLAACACCGGNGDQWLEPSWNGPPFTHGRIDISQEISRIGGIEIGDLGGIHTGAATHSNIAIEVSLCSKTNGILERGIGGFDAHLVIENGVNALGAECFERNGNGFAMHQVRVSYHHDPARA